MTFDSVFTTNKQELYKKQILDLPVTKEEFSSLITSYGDLYMTSRTNYLKRSDQDRRKVKWLLDQKHYSRLYKETMLQNYYYKYIDAHGFMNLNSKIKSLFKGTPISDLIKPYDSGVEYINGTTEDFLKDVFEHYRTIILYLIELKKLKFGK